MTKRVKLEARSGFEMQAEVAEPAGDARAPGVVLVQEWWGVNDHVKDLTTRLAGEGFLVIAPDLYDGKTTKDPAEAGALMQALDTARAVDQIAGAVAWLKASPRCSGKVGVTGFCMGGALTVLSLQMASEADAGVVWYGYPPLEFVDASAIRVPVMAHWAEQDNPFPIAGVDALEAKFEAAGVAYEGHRYLAQHGFANETAQGPKRLPITQYDAAWAELAWDRTFRFFGRALA